MTYQTFKILGLLLTYPEPVLIDGIDECVEILKKEGLILNTYWESLQDFLTHLKNAELLELQENYVTLFDRNPSLSLHLFEHIHGESRDRGQAMVDLLAQYQSKGLTLKKGELPDYLPVFLEFLSVLELEAAKRFLKEPIKIISELGKRLKLQGSDYHIIFNILEETSGCHTAA